MEQTALSPFSISISQDSHSQAGSTSTSEKNPALLTFIPFFLFKESSGAFHFLSTWENVTLLWYLLSLHDRILHQQHVVATVVRMNRDFEISTLHTSCQSKCRRRILQLEEFSRLGLVVKVNRSVNQHSAHEPAHLQNWGEQQERAASKLHLFHVDQLCPFVRLRVIALDRAENCLHIRDDQG